MIQEDDITLLRSILGEERVSTGLSVRQLHSHDESFHPPVLPDVVLWPQSTEDVKRAVCWAWERDVPVTPWGVGSSLEGNPIPLNEGMVISFEQMNRVLAVRQEDFQVDVEAGVVYKELNKMVSHKGLFFPPDPGAAATIGGMIGNNASGIRTVKYGATKDYVMALTVVLPQGDVIRVGTRARKSSAGYNLCALFTGSEGTLGIVTEATLRLVPLPVKYMALRVTFPSVYDATTTVFHIMSSGLEPAAMEFVDGPVIAVVNRDRDLSMDESPTLLMEFHGFSENGLQDEMVCVEEICRDNHCMFVDKGIGEMERSRLWEMRHLTFESIKRSCPGLLPLIVDVAVPLSRYSDMVSVIKEEIRELSSAFVFGHAGDGNVHVVIMDDPSDPMRWGKVEEVNRRIVDRALALEGTCTGEHGIGMGKCLFMEKEHGDSVGLMRAIKGLMDPKNLLNPGKFFPR